LGSLAKPQPDRSGERGSPFVLPRNVWVVTITSFLTDVSSEMVFNLLPIFLFNVLGARTGLIGVIEGVAETTASLLKMVSGTVSDRLQKRKALAVYGRAKLDRLMDVKRRYDPTNLFRINHNIPPIA